LEEEERMQRPKDTKGVSRNHHWKKEKRECKDQKKKKDKQWYTKYYTEDKIFRQNTNPLQSGGQLRCFGRLRSFCTFSGARCVTFKQNEHHLTSYSSRVTKS
jgi:hypothetical protein